MPVPMALVSVIPQPVPGLALVNESSILRTCSGARGAPPPPTEAVEIDVSAQPTFTPYEVAPEITNRSAVQSALVREYPAVLRDAGVGGTVLMHFFIDNTGSLENVLVAQTSGFEQLDQAAMRVAEVFEFSPALNRDERVAVWIQVPITFTTN